MEILDTPTMPHIETLYAFLAHDDDGDEGVCGLKTPAGWVAMVAADRARVDSLIPVAEKMAQEGDYEIRLVKFTTREEIQSWGHA